MQAQFKTLTIHVDFGFILQFPSKELIDFVSIEINILINGKIYLSFPKTMYNMKSNKKKKKR